MSYKKVIKTVNSFLLLSSGLNK